MGREQQRQIPPENNINKGGEIAIYATVACIFLLVLAGLVYCFIFRKSKSRNKQNKSQSENKLNEPKNENESSKSISEDKSSKSISEDKSSKSISENELSESKSENELSESKSENESIESENEDVLSKSKSKNKLSELESEDDDLSESENENETIPRQKKLTNNTMYWYYKYNGNTRCKDLSNINMHDQSELQKLSVKERVNCFLLYFAAIIKEINATHYDDKLVSIDHNGTLFSDYVFLSSNREREWTLELILKFCSAMVNSTIKLCHFKAEAEYTKYDTKKYRYKKDFMKNNIEYTIEICYKKVYGKDAMVFTIDIKKDNIKTTLLCIRSERNTALYEALYKALYEA